MTQSLASTSPVPLIQDPFARRAALRHLSALRNMWELRTRGIMAPQTLADPARAERQVEAIEQLARELLGEDTELIINC